MPCVPITPPPALPSAGLSLAEHGLPGGVDLYWMLSPNSDMKKTPITLILAVAASGILLLSSAALAQPDDLSGASATLPSPYNRFNLNARQSQQILNLDSEWRQHYVQIEPTLMDEQKHLTNLLAMPHADPLEITSAQERVNLLKEQLTQYATTNYLKKRRVLNLGQQKELEIWMRHKLMSKLRSEP